MLTIMSSKNEPTWLSYVILLWASTSYFRSSDGLTGPGVIPMDKIWVKLGGDKGRGSFKLTYLLSILMDVDSIPNLHTVLDIYRPDLETFGHESGVKIVGS